jgi:hypothetical protein
MLQCDLMRLHELRQSLCVVSVFTEPQFVTLPRDTSPDVAFGLIEPSLLAGQYGWEP